MAECELSVLARQCLHRFPKQAQVAVEVAAWYRYHNAQALQTKTVQKEPFMSA